MIKNFLLVTDSVDHLCLQLTVDVDAEMLKFQSLLEDSYQVYSARVEISQVRKETRQVLSRGVFAATTDWAISKQCNRWWFPSNASMQMKIVVLFSEFKKIFPDFYMDIKNDGDVCVYEVRFLNLLYPTSLGKSSNVILDMANVDRNAISF